ncbi:MAG: pyridoxamine 5'-phosphate oxidase family protein, partial [Solirubrobacterales bacterium]|nr:pyridoxamine 5'-phosphate oxidase family protein [Solirubrobacterales bacterium]
MRNAPRVLSAAALVELLALDVPARLATLDSRGFPHVTPLWFLWSDGAFYFTSLTDRPHLRRLERKPRTARGAAACGDPAQADDPARLSQRVINAGELAERRSLRSPPTTCTASASTAPRTVLNTDLAKQLEASTLGARLWRLHPGQASTRHRHRRTHELYVLLAGTGRIRIGESLHTLEPVSGLLVDPAEVRQLFNDTQADR